MSKAVPYLGALAVLAFAICVTFYSNSSVAHARVPIFIALFIVFLVIIAVICRNSKNNEICGVFLEGSTKMLGSRVATFLYIPLFLTLLVGFSFLCLHIYRAIWTSAGLERQEDHLFLQPKSTGSVILSVLLIIFIIWGLSFLK